MNVIVVGAGIIGCAIARELASRGVEVRVLEARNVAAGATRASAGMLVPYLEAHERGPLFDLMTRSLGLYDEFISAAAADASTVIEYRRCGSLQIALDPAAATRLRAAQDFFPAVVQWIDTATAREMEPSLSESVQGALLVETHGYLDVNALTDALACGAIRHGGTIESGHRVTRVRPLDSAVEVATDDGRRHTADMAVIAAGTWTAQAGLSDPAAAHVHPIRGQLLRLAWRGAPLSRVLWGPECYVVPWQDGTVLVGATMEDVGFDERTTAAGVRDLLDAVCDLLPDAWRATFIDARAGLRPATSDGLPLVGLAAASDRILYATGHFRNGILLAPLTARVIADLLLDNRQDPALELMRPDRFARPGHG